MMRAQLTKLMNIQRWFATEGGCCRYPWVRSRWLLQCRPVSEELTSPCEFVFTVIINKWSMINIIAIIIIVIYFTLQVQLTLIRNWVSFSSWRTSCPGQMVISSFLSVYHHDWKSCSRMKPIMYYLELSKQNCVWSKKRMLFELFNLSKHHILVHIIALNIAWIII